MKNDLYGLLRKDIQNKIGKKVLYAKDCDLLSIQIKEKTHRQVSASTIKRFLGIVKYNFKPSKYTLDTFSKYLGYKHWQDYTGHYLDNFHTNSAKNRWEKLKGKLLDITHQSLISLKQKTDYNSKNIFLRDFVKKKFEDFMESPKSAMLFAAPDGYGKSSTMIKLTEHYFLNENAKYKDDIAGLLDGEIFFSFYTNNRVIPLLNQFLDFKINLSIGLYFINHPEQRKGRIICLIDNVDEIFSDNEKYHHLVENISRIIMANNQPWFKMVFTCRPENLEPFIYQINKNPIFKSCWFNLDFMNENIADAINIPFFEKDEIEGVLNNYQSGFGSQQLIARHENILNIISYLYLLFLFLDELVHGHKEISEIKLLNRYIQRKIISMPYYEEKIAIIDKFIELSKLGIESYAVKKIRLLASGNHHIAYNDLISKGIIYEYTHSGNLLENNTYVKFSQNIVFEYLLLEKWKINREMDIELFLEMRNYYSGNLKLQCNLLNFFARTLINDGKYDIVTQLHIEFEKKISFINLHAQIPPCLGIVSVAVKDAIRTNTQFKNEFTPWVSNSKLGKILYSLES